VARLKGSNAAIAFARLRPVTAEVQLDFTRVSELAFPFRIPGGLVEVLGSGCCPPHAGLIDRRRLPDGLLRFDSALPLNEHRDLFMRICACAAADFSVPCDAVGEQQSGVDGFALSQPVSRSSELEEQAAVDIEMRRWLMRVGPEAQRALERPAFDPMLTIRDLIDQSTGSGQGVNLR